MSEEQLRTLVASTLRARVAQSTVTTAARQIGLKREVFLRLAGGLPTRYGTLLDVAQRLGLVSIAPATMAVSSAGPLIA